MDGDDNTYLPLSPAKYAELQVLINKKAPDRKCDLCGSDNWGLSDCLWTPLRVLAKPETGGVTSDLKQIMPMALIACGTCGNTKLLHVKILGFDPREVTGGG